MAAGARATTFVTEAAGFLGIEGAHAREDDLTNLDRFYDAGIRMISPSHFFDNGIDNSALK